jgi:quinol monooxygenase YgiN
MSLIAPLSEVHDLAAKVGCGPREESEAPTMIDSLTQAQEGTTMSQFEVRAHLKVRDGQLEGFKRQAAEMMRVTREKDTGTLAYDWFLSKDGTECQVREAYVDADALVEHALNVREAREAMFAEFAYDHKMTFYGDPSPRLLALVDKVGVDATWFTLLQALEPATTH